MADGNDLRVDAFERYRLALSVGTGSTEAFNIVWRAGFEAGRVNPEPDDSEEER